MEENETNAEPIDAIIEDELKDEETAPPCEEQAEPSEAEPEPQEPDIEAMLAEAEQRGYLRGRNARIDELMSPPGGAPDNAAPPASTEILILNNLRPSVWE